MSFNLNRSLKMAKSVITANSPVLLVGTAVAGVVTTAVLSARAGYKARGIVDAAQAERDAGEKSAPLTQQEKLKLTWLCYAVPAITTASTIASCVGVHTIHTKRHAALAGLYAITAGKFDDYKEEAEKLLGAKKSQQLNDLTAQKSADGHPITASNEVTIVDGGTELCYDEWSGRWFMSNMNKIDAAVNEVNSILVDNGDLELNTFYDRLGLLPLPMGTDYGWSGETIALQYGGITSPEGRPAIAISFRQEPKPNLGRK